MKLDAYTMGFSNRTWQETLEILSAFEIQCLVDIRTLPFVRFDGNEAHDVRWGITLGETLARTRGVVPDEKHPLLLRNTGNQQIYALDWDAP